MRVPVYDQPQVAAAALPEVRSRLDVRNGLGAVAQGVAQLGQGVQHAVDAADREQRAQQEKAIAAAATDAETRWATRALDIEHGPADRSRKGFYEMQGQEALAQSASTIEALAKAREEIASKLAPGAKELFEARSKVLLLQHQKGIEVYTSAQADALNKATAAARVDAAAKTAALQYGNDALVATETEAARSALATQLHGMPGEVVQQHLAALDQKVASARLSAAVGAKDLPAAERLLAAHGDQLGADRPRLERTVATLRAQTLGEKNALALSTFARDPDSGLTDIVKFDQGRNATPETARTPEFEQAAEAERSQAIRQNTATKASAFQAAYAAYTRAGNNLNAVPAGVKDWLVAHDGKAWEDMKAIARRDAAGHGGRSSSPGSAAQLAALNELRYEMAKDPDKFAAMSPAEIARDWAPRLSPAGFREAGKLHAQVVAAAQKPDKEIKLATLVQASVINAAAHAFGEVNSKTKLPTSPSKWSAEHHQLLDRVLNEVHEQDQAYRKAHHGQGAPADQLEKWAQAQLTKHRVKGSGFFGLFGDEETVVEARAKGDVLLDEDGKPLGAEPPAPVPAAVSAAGLDLDAPASETPAVPAMDRALILSAFRNKGRPAPTEEQIRAIYARRQGTP